jgi:hypothetical protein
VSSLLKVSTLAALLGGCLASGRVGYQATVVAPAPAVVVEAPPPPPPQPEPVVEVAYVEPAAFVYVTPEVQVIEDYDYPVFFSGGIYWRQEGGVWYSSSYHDRGWVTNYNPPVHIRSIQRPEAYVHYRADVHARVGQPGYRAPVTQPIHHSEPPPRFIDHPGHGPVQHPQPMPGPQPQPMHEAHPGPGPAPQPMQPVRPLGPPAPVEPHPQPMHQAPPQPVAPMHEAHGAATPPPGPSMHATPPPMQPHAAPPPPAAHATPPPPPHAAPPPPRPSPNAKKK